MNGFLQTLKSLGSVRLAALGGIGFAMLLGFIVLMVRVGDPGMSVLFRGLSPSDGGAIIQRLEQLNVEYQASADGTRISVPADQAGRVKMLLAEEGLPNGGGVGYEIFNQPESFGTTSFLQTLNQQRALEGEIARTIRTMNGIAGARVQLVLPRRELFSREAAQARASIFLELRGTGIDRQQVSAIQHLVASAVPQLDPSRVAIIDSRGNLLAAGTGADTLTTQQSQAEERRLAVEQRLAQRVEEILGRTVGFDKVRAEVTVELDQQTLTTQSEIYDPESQVARSSQSVTDEREESEPAGGADAVSLASNLPDAQGNNANAGGGGGVVPTSKNSRTEETTNYEISKTIKNEVKNAGGLKRLSVAVLVDGRYEEKDILGEDGNPTGQKEELYTPRTQAELDQYAALVRNAVGFDADRGDSVEVANLQFAERVVEQKPDVMQSLMDNPWLRNLAQIALVGLLIILGLLVLRPLVKSLMEIAPSEQDKLLAETSKAAGHLPPPSALSQQLEDAEMAEQGAESMIDINRVDGRVKASSLKKMGEIIDKHPEEAVAIIRQWIYSES